ncbi:MAG: riboflavin biosynthesis protein RibF [Actinobacteria bacterium]|nr:riboflavin biosynthesis protein RibF [Actinomycetota bacterium]
MKVARTPSALEPAPRAVALGTFDGVHLGHQRVIQTARDTGLRSTVVTFDPHPRAALGNQVDLLSTLERRLELLEELGVDETLVVEFTLDLARLEPGEFADEVLRTIDAQIVVAGADFRFGRGRRGNLETFVAHGFVVRPVELLEGVSSTRIRDVLREGRIDEAARLLGRPFEVEGTVVAGDARGGTLGFPTANLEIPPNLLVPPFGIYAGSARGHRAAISIGTNPHYGGRERRVEPHLLDFDGDLYGQRLIVELWERLRDERAFDSEQELIAEIARDLERTRRAARPR